MTMRNLNKTQNIKLADLLLGAAKAIVIASIVAFLYPPAGSVRSVLWLIAGCVISAILAGIGLAITKDNDSSSRGRHEGR